ncbi:MAG TPA: ATP-binding protein [Vitreimonas sp.]|uniref:sensor histidine kinase n=1 Tax=Vitreimonas sp. TaxID=3069702 RepID=UPI002D5FBBC0|nr:ATP-binding protein [Vitreimonas sp.]HYD89759.1 ATP-binding protein [Vitreimonas sp.]
MSATHDKWRPSIGMITAAVIASVLVLPLVGLLFFRVFENQLVRQTESELIAQAAMLSAFYAREIEAAPRGAFPEGPPRPPSDPAVVIDERYAPILPSLDLASSPIHAARPAPIPPETPPSVAALESGRRLTEVTTATQRTTLAGFRLLDANGAVIGGREDVGLSYAHVAEVRAAMAGRVRTVMRVRDEVSEPPRIYSISRGTKIRLYVAMPVFVDDRVRGVVYISRTPDNILRALYRERDKVLATILLALAAASAIGFVFVRTIARPMRELALKAEEITAGRIEAIGPLKRHGTRELASLADSLMIMARRLSDRSDYLSGFANHVSHELKSPLTAIRGAAELIRDAESTMTPEQRERFLSNLLADTERIGALLDRLRELARADNPILGGATSLSEVAQALRARFEGLAVELQAETAPPAAMSAENADIVFGHLADNALRHGASRLSIGAREQGAKLVVEVGDNGAGISEGNRARIFDPFFTTRRAEGGTGMGLGIVRALLRAHGGDIALAESAAGAAFVLTLPIARELHTSS